MLQKLLAHASPPLFRRFSVDLGVRTIEIPVAEISGTRPGKTLLITAGMDGDEYAGMCAALKIAEVFANGAFTGRLIIVPVVNQPGNTAGVSENPLDKKYPKRIFPGRAHGSATERLVHWLTTNYISQSDAWHDLHSGAHDEHLKPFLWLTQTGVTLIDGLTQELLKITTAQIAVHEKTGMFSKARRLARRGCWFVMAESGELGEQKEADIQRHVEWVKETMTVLDMFDAVTTRKDRMPPQIFSRVKQKTRLRPTDESRLLWWKDGGPYFVSL